MACRAAVFAIAEPAGGVAAGHAAGGDGSGGGCDDAGDRAFDEYWISAGDSRPAADGDGARELEADWAAGDSRLPGADGAVGWDAGSPLDRARDLRHGAAFDRRACARDCAEGRGPGAGIARERGAEANRSG